MDYGNVCDPRDFKKALSAFEILFVEAQNEKL